MNKAFSLFEIILVLILVGFLVMFLSRTLWEFHYLNNQQLKMKDLILKTHLSTLRLEKLLQSCIDITFESNHASCLIKGDLLYLDGNQAKLLNSSLILENNTSLYSPNSNFKLQLQNRKELYNDKQNIVYALVGKEIKKIFIHSENNITTSFKGEFIPIQARLKLFLKEDKIHYELYPYFDNRLEQYSIFINNVSLFEIQKQKLKLCLKEYEQEYCLTKRLFI
ncbi:TPA: hypothetical protein RZK48_000130 [Campylobacter coli]|nr:hypothetical protein [Campylobacter coli]